MLNVDLFPGTPEVYLSGNSEDSAARESLAIAPGPSWTGGAGTEVTWDHAQHKTFDKQVDDHCHVLLDSKLFELKRYSPWFP